MKPLSQLSGDKLAGMAEAGGRILECYRLLAKGGGNIVGEVLRGQGTFYEFDHYPAGDVHDPETHCQHYYHSHRSGEHGHFHLFVREKGMPEGLRPIEQSHASFMDEREDTLCHLIAISMSPAGFPIALFSTNRWVTADNWYVAEDVIKMLDHFCMDLAYPSLPVNIWINAMLELFRPQVEDLIQIRDKTVAAWVAAHPDRDVFEDRELDITSSRRISVEKTIERVRAAAEAKR
jgi:hypothetical protein